MRSERPSPILSIAAVAALVVGIAGLVPGPLLTVLIRNATRSFVPYIPPLLLPLLALVLSRVAMRRITRSSGTVRGSHLANIARTLGIVGSVLSLLYIVSCVAELSQT